MEPLKRFGAGRMARVFGFTMSKRCHSHGRDIRFCSIILSAADRKCHRSASRGGHSALRVEAVEGGETKVGVGDVDDLHLPSFGFVGVIELVGDAE